MSDRMIPVPESALLALAEWWMNDVAARPDISALVACLPEPEPEFTDAEALAFARAVYGEHATATAGHRCLTALAKARWTAPKALCPPPSPALVELVEAARVDILRGHRLRAAVAAYDEQEG